MGYKVLIPQEVDRAGKEYLLERGYEIRMGSGISRDILAREVEDCDGALVRTARFTEEILIAGKKLKVIAKHGIGVDNIDVGKAAERGIYVVITPLANSNTVAEHTIGLVLACAKNLTRCEREFRKGDFDVRRRLLGTDLEGKTLGLIGVGRIGTLVAQKAVYGFGMRVMGYDPYVSRDKVAPEIELIGDWKYIFENADFISLHLPLTPETRGMIGAKAFAVMKPSAFFINAARGEIVDEAALIKALQEERIAGAGLDVFEKEPPAKENPLFALDNVVLTPHNAALTREATMKMSLHAAMGIDAVLSGKKPSWPVNKPKI